jgi:hypothetical protein
MAQSTGAKLHTRRKGASLEGLSRPNKNQPWALKKTQLQRRSDQRWDALTKIKHRAGQRTTAPETEWDWGALLRPRQAKRAGNQWPASRPTRLENQERKYAGPLLAWTRRTKTEQVAPNQNHVRPNIKERIKNSSTGNNTGHADRWRPGAVHATPHRATASSALEHNRNQAAPLLHAQDLEHQQDERAGAGDQYNGGKNIRKQKFRYMMTTKAGKPNWKWKITQIYSQCKGNSEAHNQDAKIVFLLKSTRLQPIRLKTKNRVLGSLLL